MLAGPVHAAAPDAADAAMMDFKLFNHCGPMRLSVDPLPPEAEQAGLTHDSLHAALESRLRAAGLHLRDDGSISSSLSPWLNLNVNTGGNGYSIILEYKKLVCAIGWERDDPTCHVDPSVCGGATTWSTGTTGTYGSNIMAIRPIVSEHIDEFLAAYLRINERACN